jgi:hypothetical protein
MEMFNLILTNVEKYFNDTMQRLEAAINDLAFEADNQIQVIEKNVI